MAGDRAVNEAPQSRPANKMGLSYFIGWVLFRLAFATWFRWRVFNAERVPLRGPVILACNHASYLDTPVIGVTVWRHINYLARESLFSVPVVGAILRSWRVVPVDRDGGTGRGLRAILDRLEKGGAIILFPEGTRTPDGRLQPAQSGIGLAIIKSSAPVTPARVFGSYEAFGRHMSFPRPRRIMVKFGQPMNFDALRAEARTCPRPRLKQIYQQVADELMAAIARLEPKED